MKALQIEQVGDLLEDINALTFGFIYNNTKDFVGKEIENNLFRLGLMIGDKVKQAKEILEKGDEE